MKPALVILAAGASRRLGQCKALVELTPRNPLELLAAAGACLDDAPPLVVTGADHDLIAAFASSRDGSALGLELCRNAGWNRGRTGGILLAHRARPGRDLCLAPVDVPLVPARVLERLLQAWEAAGSPPRGWLAPRIARGGAFGHPVLAGRELLADLAELGPAAPLSRLRAAADPLLAVEVDAPEILDDLDRPEDLERILRRIRGI